MSQDFAFAASLWCRFTNRAALMSVLLLTTLGTLPAHAQVVNSGPSSTSSTSQVTLSVSIPAIVFVRVNAATSTLSSTFNPALIDSANNVASQDFKILGDVLANQGSANVQCSVSTTSLSLTNGTDSVSVGISGTIGGTNINTTGFTPTFSNKKAAINLIGDLDESTITSSKSPGTYAGTLTITATLL